MNNRTMAENNKINLYYGENHVRIALDETCTERDFNVLIRMFDTIKSVQNGHPAPGGADSKIPGFAERSSDYFHSEY